MDLQAGVAGSCCNMQPLEFLKPICRKLRLGYLQMVV